MDRFTFLRWVRSGAAGSITGTEGAATTATRPTFPVVVRVDGVGDVARDIALHGPGDVVGIKPGQIIRRFPSPGATTADASRFAHVELDDPDLPWRYSPFRERTAADPAGATLLSEGTLTPWLCLIVAQEKAGVTVGYSAGDLLPTLTITDPAVPDEELPKAGEIAAWAHTQIGGDLPQNPTSLFDNEPHRALSRLVSPRLLQPDTAYVACLVPVFAAGRQAGLGEPVTAPLDERAWAAGVSTVRLPIYDSYRFSTGPGGDFEALVRRLKHVRLDGITDADGNVLVGTRLVDVSSPDFGVPNRPGPLSADLYGALSLSPSGMLALPDAQLGDDIAAAADVEGKVAPPVYGRWHAAAAVPGRAGWPSWVATLNRHPGLRVVAGQGARLVADRQEDFMAACWEQVGAINEANQLLRQAQLAEHASTALYRRHVTVLAPEAALQLLGPALTRLRSPADPRRTQAADLDATCLPRLSIAGSFQRLLRPRGPLVRRIERWMSTDVPRRYDPALVVGALGAGDRLRPAPTPDPAIRLSLGAALGGIDPPAKWPDRQPDPADVNALQQTLGTLAERVAQPPRCQPADLPAAASAAVTAVDPASTVPRRARAQLSLPAGLWDPPERIDPILVAPEITTPMYSALAAQGQDWLLPGLQHVPSDSVSALAANQAFVEVLLAGMNHEMSRELLWRGYPTDQRGTVFRHFWDRRVDASPPPGDITRLHTWTPASTLGTHSAGPVPQQSFVFLLRGQLLRMFPRTSIFLVRATVSGGVTRPVQVDATAKLPVFSGWLDPDVTFLGFDVGVAEVRGANPQTAADPGWFVVIQEQPTQPSFGVSAEAGGLGPNGRYASWADLGVKDLAVVGGRVENGDPFGYVDLAATTTAAFLARAPTGAPSWDGRSDSLAVILLRRPFRLFLHGSDLLESA